MAPPDARRLLSGGVADAVGFLGGALAGFWLGQWLGMDIFAPGYGGASLVGILLVGMGGGLGVQLARRWQALRGKDDPAP
ncbi:MAG: hypothetical protein ABS38_13995 [Acidovorax sp. SCN 68-22]|nr:MAG: hypothetical protein ABS38_13995 [Acidovorax sp. SCN 68-22]